MSHESHIPEPVWVWAQRKSGKKNPSTFIREVLISAMIKDIQGEAPPVNLPAEDTREDQWEKLGMELSPADSEFTNARAAFVTHVNDEDAAIEFFRKGASRGMHSPRAWLIGWYREHKPQVELHRLPNSIGRQPERL